MLWAMNDYDWVVVGIVDNKVTSCTGPFPGPIEAEFFRARAAKAIPDTTWVKFTLHSETEALHHIVTHLLGS
jgi:hypothetical protein